MPTGQEIVCHFSQDQARVTKILDFINKHPRYMVVKKFFNYLGTFFRNSAETEPRSWFFGIENHKIDFFFYFFVTKTSNFISNMNEDFYKDSFEVYNTSVGQKLVILGFSPKIFIILTLVTSETFWGQTMTLSDLTEVSNFNWRCQLLYEVLFVELEWKLKHSETSNSQWVMWYLVLIHISFNKLCKSRRSWNDR